MSTIYVNPPNNAVEMRRRANELLTTPAYRAEVQNNVEMLTRMLGHAMLAIADLTDRVTYLENMDAKLK